MKAMHGRFFQGTAGAEKQHKRWEVQQTVKGMLHKLLNKW
jgi:hypothetical protein